jgi:hypothetical protein
MVVDILVSGSVRVSVTLTVLRVPVVMIVPGVWVDACGGTVVAGVVVAVPGVWLVQPVTSTAALTKQSRRIKMVRGSMIEEPFKSWNI